MQESVGLACDPSIRQEVLLLFAAACLISGFLLLRLLRSRAGKDFTHVGLQLSYLANFWILHWISVPLYLLPWYCNEHASYVVLGARQSLIGLLGLTLGMLLALAVFKVRMGPITAPAPIVSKRLRTGLLTLGVLLYLAPSLPGLQAVQSEGQALLVAAVALAIWQASIAQDRRSVLKWMGISILFPFLTIIRGGFLGFGVAALLPILVITFAWTRRFSLKTAVVGLFAVYLGLSFYINYMRDRTEIRRTVWGGQGLSARFDRLATTFANWEWFSPWDTRHLDYIDGRLNQDYLVGASVVYTDNTKELAHGATLWNAALAFIPRVVWPDKPIMTSGGLVTQYTGIHFMTGTSVGIGHVMEFYVNFGWITVFLGLMVFGFVLGWLDVKGISGLRSGNFQEFLPYFLVGLALQLVGDSLMETMGAAAAGVVVAYAFKMLMGTRKAPELAAVGTPGVPSPVAFRG